MAQINLLPWREEFRQEKKNEFIKQLAGVAVLGGLMCYLWVMSMNNSITDQQQRNSILQNEINQLNQQVKEINELKKRRKELLDRMKVIQDLEGKRSIIVHYFDEFVKAVPDGIYITSLKKTDNMLFIEGVSESNTRVSAFMRRLNDSSWFSDPNLNSVVSAPKKGDQAGTFVMQLKTVLPDTGEKNGS
ncbi:PilN domain-containing protein [Teredinibacter sp. KSP-S5-2]|uniref:PilN domain-containing protein n=1 Tax=Teredinibacter sp. KSP-S5-2 TaxID=3034506 RepID=UPI002934C8F2|nr:PilN domain-containing protein [Teredinibacter sp. KSP-S5-2]WNO08195.1 PilN domain-containing protein [Teredinibacter sp. KSP-S5-2]